jgi:hypothetical protein
MRKLSLPRWTAVCLLACAAAGHAADTTNCWTGATGTNWSDAANWDANGVPDATNEVAAFAGPTNGVNQPFLDATVSVRRLHFFSGGWTLSGAGTINRPKGNTTVINVDEGTVTVGAGVVLADGANDSSGDDFTVAAGAKLLLHGRLNSRPTGFFGAYGGGTVYLAASNSLNSPVNVHNDTLLVVAHDFALLPASGVQVNASGEHGTVAADGGTRTIAVSGIQSSGGAHLTLGDPQNVFTSDFVVPALPAVTSVSSYMEKCGRSQVTLLNAVNNFNIKFYIYEGTLSVSHALALGPGTNANNVVTLAGGKLAAEAGVVFGRPFTFSSGRIGGNGTFAQAAGITVASTNHLDPGFGVGRTTFATNLALSGTYTWELGACRDDATGTAGTDFDQVVVSNGTLTVGGTAGLDIRFLNGTAPSSIPFWRRPHTWTILDAPADTATTFAFARVTNHWTSLGSFTNVLSNGDTLLQWAPSGWYKGTVVCFH